MKYKLPVIIPPTQAPSHDKALFWSAFLWIGKQEPGFLMVPVTQEHHLHDLHGYLRQEQGSQREAPRSPKDQWAMNQVPQTFRWAPFPQYRDPQRLPSQPLRCSSYRKSRIIQSGQEAAQRGNHRKTRA